MRFFLWISLAVVWATPAGAFFDELPLSPRARGMGLAVTASARDAWAFHYNPALLPGLEHPEAGLATLRPNGTGFNRLTAAALATRLPGRAGALAVGWRRFDVDFGGVDLATENTLSFSHGFDLFRDASTSASFGWTVHVYRAEFAPTVGTGDGTDGVDPGDAWAVGVDVAALVSVYDRTRVGFRTRNLNNPTIGDDQEELGREVAVGIAYEPYSGVTSAFDVRSALGQEFRFCGGLEVELDPVFVLRAGLETEPSKLTGGFGFRLPVASFDYGFSTGGGVLDTSHHFGIGLRWDRTGGIEP